MSATPNLLFFRLAEFLRARREVIVTDATAGLSAAGSVSLPWPRRLTALVQGTSDRLLARAAMVENGPVELPGPAADAPDTIQDLLQQGTAVRNAFLRALNRFQAEQAERHDFTPLEMTAARQESLQEFDSLLAAALATWISRESQRLGSIDPHGLAEVHEGLHALAGLLRLAVENVPPSARRHVTAAGQQLARLTTRLGEAMGDRPPPSAPPAPSVPESGAEPASSLPPPRPVSAPAPAPRPPPARREPLRLTPLHVDSFLQALTEAFRPAAEARGLQFETRFGPEPEIIHTDAAKLHQAASLVLDHAVQQAAGGRLTLTAGLASNSRWQLAVHASASTLAPEELTRILGGLSSSPEAAEASEPHLNLTLARELTSLLRGTFEAEAGEGLHVRLLLPAD